MEKTAVDTPMPKAMAPMASSAGVGRLRMSRQACRRSFLRSLVNMRFLVSMSIRVVGFCVLAAGTAYAQAEARATGYLIVEVPRWEKENHCFSCHNNGDGARVLYAASRLGFAIP